MILKIGGMEDKIVFSGGIMIFLMFSIGFVIGAENLCGDGVCQNESEGELTCPRDCVDLVEMGFIEEEGFDSSDLIRNAFDRGTIDEDLDENSVLDKLVEDGGFSDSTLKMAVFGLFFIVLVIIALVIYLKMKKTGVVSGSGLPAAEAHDIVVPV